MSGKTVTRSDLADAVVAKVGLKYPEASEMVETVIEEICTVLGRGEEVKLSSFATFNVSEKSARMGRNPKTGEEAEITSRRVVQFSASNVLKGRVLREHQKRLAK